MTITEYDLIASLRDQKIGMTEFEEKLPVNIYDDRAYSAYVIAKVEEAILNQNEDELELAIYLIWLSKQYDKNWNLDLNPYLNILNRLLLIPFHRSHQMIAKALQDLRSPSSIPFVRKVFESKLDYLAYTYSESAVITKWFSWLLAEIGTKEAIELMKEFSDSSDEGIRDEMKYRLKRVEERQPRLL